VTQHLQPGLAAAELEARKSSDVDISIVIPAYFGAATIADCLTALERAAAGRRYEIIVVESSGDGAREIIRSRFPNVTLIEPATRLTAGGARNRGAAAARGERIYFTDQDCVVPPEWIGRLGRYLDDPTVGAAGGSVGIRNLSSLSGCAMYFLEFLRHFPIFGPPRRDDNFLVGCNSVYRASVLQVVKFPDQTLGEDVIFSHDLQQNGFGVMYDARVAVLHQNREGWREFFRYNKEMGRSAAIYHGVLRRWWVRPFFEAPILAFLAPTVILPSIAYDLLWSQPSYFFRFALLSPMCLIGNLVWANAFRRQVLKARKGGERQ
jgi:GT2 family glycosyltransferase